MPAEVRLTRNEIVVPVQRVHTYAPLDHVPPMWTGAKVIRQAFGGGPQVSAGRQPHEPDRGAVLVAQADLDTILPNDDGDILTWSGSHVLPLC